MSAPLRVVIVGGVAGGMSAATRLRRLDESAQIVVFERGPEVSYANCGLPYYVGGVIEERDALLLQTPESLHRRFRLDVRVRHDVVGIDTARKTVEVVDLDSCHRSTHPYDRLVLATGARPRGDEPTGALPARSLRTVADADAIDAALRPGLPVVVVGGGYTGLEAVENLVARGAAVTLVQRGAQLLAPLDPEMAAPLAAEVRRRGVDVRLGVEVVATAADSVTLSDGATLPAEFLVDASGVVPEVGLARAAGIRLGETGGIAVDEACRTSAPDVFAVGDGVEKADLIGGGAALVTMAGLANRHGRMVADVIAGREASARPALGTGIVQMFGLAAAKTGWSEKQLRAAGRGFFAVHVHPASHAGYYPGAETLSMKLLADPATDRILGAQIVGRDGVDKRIDVIATALQAGATASGLAHLELAYAPQFGSAKDAVNILGYVAENTRNGTTPTVQWHELDDALQAGSTLIDVRSAAEHANGAIPGARNIPLDELRDRLDELPDGPLVVHCQVGLRGHIATRLLRQHGREVRNLDGGYRTWRDATVGS
ncbi:FAD-dependent oxidoreductase [Microbacterium paraoxydans]|uniref:NADPH-dependent 2,4-dienoyl-CoA reductase, sulfur reductase n=3 Tax=Microbacterium paraoxydans TaxID=199592 RepID=A0A1H1U4T8_9MICO|nr:FAD-dependent oxidoreductase [Microbacterium paraoxydans]SDS67434.1 NADPH-dependent 2,4-dienoyl-CoA reductase, sulfur reductase [Microbacterium paraoxydans]